MVMVSWLQLVCLRKCCPALKLELTAAVPRLHSQSQDCIRSPKLRSSCRSQKKSRPELLKAVNSEKETVKSGTLNLEAKSKSRILKLRSLPPSCRATLDTGCAGSMDVIGVRESLLRHWMCW